MDRRKALKNIGTGFGAIAVTPTVVSLFQSCQTAPSYALAYFSSNDFEKIGQLMELIIPSTDIPGALELKLPEFADGYIAAVWNAERQEQFANGWSAFLSASSEISGKEVDQMTTADWDQVLSKFLKAGNEISDSEKDAATFAGQLRSLTVSAFKTSEFIGENVLAYAPVPGEQRGCVDLMEATGGKAWSL
jgi:hypothetical protein